MTDLSNALENLRRESQRGLGMEPPTVCFILTCGYEFEPHGRASETWETIWTLSLPRVASYRHHPDNTWRLFDSDRQQSFTARTVEEVVQKALDFYRACNPHAQPRAAVPKEG